MPRHRHRSTGEPRVSSVGRRGDQIGTARRGACSTAGLASVARSRGTAMCGIDIKLSRRRNAARRVHPETFDARAPISPGRGSPRPITPHFPRRTRAMREAFHHVTFQMAHSWLFSRAEISEAPIRVLQPIAARGGGKTHGMRFEVVAPPTAHDSNAVFDLALPDVGLVARWRHPPPASRGRKRECRPPATSDQLARRRRPGISSKSRALYRAPRVGEVRMPGPWVPRAPIHRKGNVEWQRDFRRRPIRPMSSRCPDRSLWRVPSAGRYSPARPSDNRSRARSVRDTRPGSDRAYLRDGA